MKNLATERRSVAVGSGPCARDRYTEEQIRSRRSGTAQRTSGTARRASGTARRASGTARRASGTARRASGTARRASADPAATRLGVRRRGAPR
ncbi:hypothetical protein EXE45_08535 [Halorubrum sp. SP9]|nr:hypothetical protein EXE45_08535 [Halorubrum sp. SP9]